MTMYDKNNPSALGKLTEFDRLKSIPVRRRPSWTLTAPRLPPRRQLPSPSPRTPRPKSSFQTKMKKMKTVVAVVCSRTLTAALTTTTTKLSPAPDAP